MISKELLSCVLKHKIHYIHNKLDDTNLLYEYESAHGYIQTDINIYELAHKCKDWAYEQGFYLVSGYNTNVPICAPKEDDDFIYECSIYRDDSWTYEFCKQYSNNYSEQQAVFDCCQFILDNKEAKNELAIWN